MSRVEALVAVDLMLPPEATSAGEARRLLRDALAGVEFEDSMDAAQVAVSEIVTNALVHAGTPMRFRVLLGTPGLRVELGDGSPHLPRRRDYSDVASTGRGLHVVGEVVDSWGAYPSGGGKVVWFEIADGEDEYAGESDAADPASPEAAGAVEVELLNVPLLMHAAWQEHAAALLRELLLIRLDEEDEAIERHAAASDALNVLFEQIPEPDLGEHPEAILAAATEPSVSRTRIVLRIPAKSMAHFELLDSALIEAVAMAEDGQLLSPPTQPEIQALRKWICEQVLSQGAGTTARPWESPTDPQPPMPVGARVWDSAVVSESPRALLAADDANQVVAVSPSALARLGYAEAADLVGHRLISIIPLRFRQAHIAGFTLHLINGRSPLIGDRVTVPVRRADGSEVDIALQIESVALPNGRRLFTAEFFD
jgi:PAS domain S-box-containing protein